MLAFCCISSLSSFEDLNPKESSQIEWGLSLLLGFEEQRGCHLPSNSELDESLIELE